MNNEKILNAIGKISDELVMDAAIIPKKKTSTMNWKRWAAMAACFVLILGLGIGGINLLKRNNGIPSGETQQNPTRPGEVMQNPTQQEIGDDTNLSSDAVIDRPIVWQNTNGEIVDAGLIEWNGKTITFPLYGALSDENNKDSWLAVSVVFKIDTSFVYNDKTIAEYASEADDERLLLGKLGGLLKLGDSLKYGEALYKTGTPTGEKWAKELYDETVKDIGKDIIAKYIVDGEFLAEKLEADIVMYSENKACRIAYEEARNAYYEFAVKEAIKILENQNIKYEKRNEVELVFFITAEDFTSLDLDNAFNYGLALKDGEGMDYVEVS